MPKNKQIPMRPAGFKQSMAEPISNAVRQLLPDVTTADINGAFLGDDTVDSERAQTIHNAIIESGFPEKHVVAAFNHMKAKQALKAAGHTEEDSGGRLAPKLPGQLPDCLLEHFRPLGFRSGAYAFLSHRQRRVIEITASQTSSRPMLYQLAPRMAWADAFNCEPDDNWGDLAAELIADTCATAGAFDPSLVRGRGAFEDDGRSVINLGNTLVVNGSETPMMDLETRYFYGSGPTINIDLSNPLTAEEGQAYIDMIKMARWDRPISAVLLAGWTALAGACGAWEWRPHIYVTGPAGSGKTWITEHVIKQALKSTAVNALGESTGPGIRQHLKTDALPIVIDEFEGESNEERANLQRVMKLARQASSETDAKVLKGTADGDGNSFELRTSFCFVSINVNVQASADESRVSTLSLRAPDIITEADREADEEAFRQLEQRQIEVMTKGFADRLLARMVRMIPTIRANTETFRKAVALTVGGSRAGQQLGALLAGAYALVNDKEISLEDAKRFVQSQDWSEYVRAADDTEERKLLHEILQAKMRDEEIDGRRGWTIAEALESALDEKSVEAHTALGRHGIRVDPNEGTILFASANRNLKELLRNTPWHANYSRILMRIKGAESGGSQRRRFAGANSAFFTIPLSAVRSDDSEEVAKAA